MARKRHLEKVWGGGGGGKKKEKSNGTREKKRIGQTRAGRGGRAN